MKCPRCESENREGRRFCSKCGAPLALACAACGFVNEPGDEFCGGCGARLAASTPALAVRFSSPQVYTPRHLAERILTSKAALEGERKQVTVLFADLKGSMELLADRDPEEARKILDPVLELMMEAVHRYEGTVNQVMGDGIMALFGAPLAHEDHAVRACYAALRMQRRVNLYADEMQRGGGTPVQIRVGLNSGEVVVRSIGSDLHMDYTAVGQTTHLAARMEQMAKPGSVLITGETLKLAEGFIQVRPLGAVTVKGLETATQVYELTAIGPARSRLQASAARGLTRFVGRESELRQLGQALERAATGHGQAIAVVGEAGVGKSRLLWEFTRSHRTQGWLGLESRSVSYGKATPYLPVIELFKSYFRIQDRDDQREIRERVAGKLVMLDRVLEPLMIPLLALLDVPVADDEWNALDPPQRRQRTLEAVKRLLLRESQVQPLLVIFEDLHWIDSETQALLDGLVESLPTARLLLLVSYRPEYQHSWGRKSYYLQLRIDPLPPESVEELLAALLGDDATLEPLKRLLIGRTEGNPFFLEESVRTLVETNLFAGEPGAYRLTKAREPLQIPSTAQAIVAARIDRLEIGDKWLLQVASVIGKDVPLQLLEAIADMPRDELRQRLARLQGGEFLYEARLFPDVEYTFKHALTHDVTYGGLLQERRRDLHSRCVDFIEALSRDRLDEQIERLAYHAFHAAVWQKAVTYSRKAGLKAFARSANHEAVAMFEQALEALQHLPETRQTFEQAIDIRFELRSALLPLGHIDRILERLREADNIAVRLDDHRRLGWVATYMTIYYILTADTERSVAAGERAIANASRASDSGLQIVANSYLGNAYHDRGNYARAVEQCQRSVEALPEGLRHERFGQATLPSVYSRVLWALSATELGAFMEAAARAREAVQIAEEVNQPFSLGFALLALGGLHVRKGDWSAAIVALERGLELCRGRMIRLWIPMTSASLGYAYAHAQAPHKALPLLEQGVEQAEAMKIFWQHCLGLVQLGECYLLAGQADKALTTAERALELSEKRTQRGAEAWALRLLAELASASRTPSDIDATRQRYRRAILLADELGMRPLIAHCHLGLGKRYRRTGKRSESDEHFATATAMYREMGMTYWLEQAEREMNEPA